MKPLAYMYANGQPLSYNGSVARLRVSAVPNRVVEQLDEKIHQLEAWLTGLRTVRTMLAEDPAFVVLLQDLILNPESNGILDPDRAVAAKEPGLPKHERIKEYFKAHRNEWMSIRQIAAGTQISRNTVADILYHKYSHMFDGKNTGKNRKYWRVKMEGGEPVPTYAEDEPEEPPKATVPFGIGEEKPERPRPKSKY